MEPTRSTRWIILVMAFSALYAVGLINAIRASSATSLHNVTLTGVMLPEGHEPSANVYTLRFKDETWNFKVLDVRVPQPSSWGVSGWAILNDIGRQRLRLVGKKEFVEALNRSDLECKPLRIRGTLYVSSGTLALGSAVDQAPGQKPPEICD